MKKKKRNKKKGINWKLYKVKLVARVPLMASVDSKWTLRNSLAVQWLKLGTLTAGVLGWIPGQGTKIPQAAWHSQKKKSISEQPEKLR